LADVVEGFTESGVPGVEHFGITMVPLDLSFRIVGVSSYQAGCTRTEKLQTMEFKMEFKSALPRMHGQARARRHEAVADLQQLHVDEGMQNWTKCLMKSRTTNTSCHIS